MRFTDKRLEQMQMFLFYFFFQSKKRLQYFHGDYVSSGISWNEFRVYAEQKTDHSLLEFNKHFNIFKGKYIKNFSEAYIRKKFLVNNVQK